jgi:two-component system, NarL family, nitrate/nitrite response regulator NarL
MSTVNIVIADDHKVVLDGLEAILRTQPDFEVVGRAIHGEQVLALLRSRTVNVVVLDIAMKDGMDGVETARQILDKHTHVSVLMLSMHGEYAYVRNLKDLGVHGYLLKEEEGTELIAAVRALADGREYFSRKVNEISRSMNPSKSTVGEVKFTKREKEVLAGLAQGWENQRIADGMGVEISTVETHLKSIRVKTGIGSGRGLVRFAIDGGFGVRVS